MRGDSTLDNVFSGEDMEEVGVDGRGEEVPVDFFPDSDCSFIVVYSDFVRKKKGRK